MSFRDKHFSLKRRGAPEDVWTNLDYSPVRGDDGKPGGVLAIVVDTTPWVHAERAQRESESRFRTLADNIAAFAWMADETGNIYWYNKRWFDYTGLPFDEPKQWGWPPAAAPRPCRARHGKDQPLPLDRRGMGRHIPAEGARRRLSLVPVARHADPRRGRQRRSLVRHQYGHHRAPRGGGAQHAARNHRRHLVRRHHLDVAATASCNRGTPAPSACSAIPPTR